MNERLGDRLLSAELQIKRLVADAESEKEIRKERNKGIDQELKKLKDDIHGNGKEGLKVRLDRLERERKLLIAVVIAMAPLIAKMIYDLIKLL
jgi:uncharacterized membrane protein YdbT with pleckstrin-like domain